MRIPGLLSAMLFLTALALAACQSLPQPASTAPAMLTPTLARPTPTGASVAQPASNTTGGVAALPDIAGVVERVAPAVVSVITKTQQRDIFGRPFESTGSGSGVIFDARGYVLTNNHVVQGATFIEVSLTNSQRLPVEVVGTDPQSDLAVLKIDPAKVNGGIVVAPLGDSDAMRVGDWIIAIGNPLGFLGGTVTVGIISAKDRQLDVSPTEVLYDMLQTDAVINPGNSGGPLLNLKGEVIGINTAIIRGTLSSGQRADGIGFSISSRAAAPVAQQLIESGRVVRPRLGVYIDDVDPVLASREGLSVEAGVYVSALIPGGPAERVGLRPGDVIVAIDGQSVTKTSELQRLMLTRYKVSDTVRVSVVRSAVQLTFDVTLEASPTS
ncbi:MAG: trypsin-like serine protease [SAR202 cluster bacterium]|nr:trypsin-like serine protease [SAR202 cluster bacterium]